MAPARATYFPTTPRVDSFSTIPTWTVPHPSNSVELVLVLLLLLARNSFYCSCIYMLGEVWSVGRDVSRYVGGPPAPSRPLRSWRWPTEPTPSPYHTASRSSAAPTEQRNEMEYIGDFIPFSIISL